MNHRGVLREPWFPCFAKVLFCETEVRMCCGFTVNVFPAAPHGGLLDGALNGRIAREFLHRWVSG